MPLKFVLQCCLVALSFEEKEILSVLLALVCIALRLPFVSPCTSNLYRVAPPICIGMLLETICGWDRGDVPHRCIVASLHTCACLCMFGVGGPLTLTLLQKYRDRNGRRIVIRIGGVYIQFSAKRKASCCKTRKMGGVP